MISQAKIFVLKKLEECFLFTHEDYPESIFHIWDKQFIRIKKLQRLSDKNKEIQFRPGKSSLYLFEQDYKNGWFRYDYNHIYRVLIDDYKLNYKEINKLIQDILQNETPLMIKDCRCNLNLLNEDDDNKMKILIPANNVPLSNRGLDNKMSLLKPIDAHQHSDIGLNDNKMKLLTLETVSSSHKLLIPKNHNMFFESLKDNNLTLLEI